MPDSAGDGKASIPAWQKTPQAGTMPSASGDSSTADGGPPSSSRTELIDQAKRFLEDESIRDASRERKVAFLEKKGLHDDDVQKLLGPVPEFSSSSSSSSSSEQGPDMKTVHDSNKSAPSASLIPRVSDTQKTSQKTSTPSTSSSREIPPIITYPEFLLRPMKPPPLITLQRLTYVFYTLASTSAVTYGAGKYLVQPMLSSLTSARHDLANTTIHNLEKLNDQLESTVSHIPFTMTSSMLLKNQQQQHRDRGETRRDSASDIDSVESDPTELYHRDFATQTTPTLARTPSVTSMNSSSQQQQQSDQNLTSTQSSRLINLRTDLTSILRSQTSSTETAASLKDTIADFQSYLDTLQFNNNSYMDYNHIHGASEDKKSTNKSRRGTEENDEAAKFKAEIRAVKGALLSSRNFPAGRPATGTVSGLAVR